MPGKEKPDRNERPRMSDVSVLLGSSDEVKEGVIRAFPLEQEEGGKVLVARQGGSLCVHLA